MIMKINEGVSLFRALSDATRLRILSVLGEGELCVCDLIEILRLPQSKISRHLAILRAAQLVEARKEGLWMHYRLSKPSRRLFREVLNVMANCRCDCEELGSDLQRMKNKEKSLVGCCK